MSAAETLEPGGMIADYRIDRVLGSGSFGVTYGAHDVQLARNVAIKEYMPVDYARRDASGTVGSRNPETATTFEWGLRRFSDEARTLAQFDHPNIVKVQRLVQGVNGTAYIVMELLEGINLETLVERDGPLSTEVFLSVFRQLLGGVEAIHGIGILHRDIKPANIVIKGETPVLIDFGASRDLATQRKAGFSALVTDGYSPLEQYSSEKEQSQASDIYALAATAYYLLTGKIPPPVTARVAGDSFPTISEAAKGLLPDDVLKALDWGLALQQADRPQSIAQWRAAMPSLDHVEEVPLVAAPPVAPKVNRRALLVTAAGVVVAGGAAALFFGRDSSIAGSAAPFTPGWSKVVAPIYDDPFAAIAATADGAMVAAYRGAGDATDRLIAIRYGNDGSERGSFTLDQPASRGHAILPTPDGGAYVGGESGAQSIIVRLDKDWHVAWTRNYQAGSISALMHQRDKGLIAGLEGPRGSGTAKLLYVGEDGALQNDVTLLDRQGDSVQRIVPLSDGAVAVLGLRLEPRLVDGKKQYVENLWLARVAASGEEQWRILEKGLGHSWGFDVVEAGGSIFVAGRTSTDGEAHRLLLMRVDAQGHRTWSRSDYAGAPASGRGLAVTGGSSPRVYAVGWAGMPHRARFSQIGPSGDLIWDQLDEPNPGGESIAGLALRPDGSGFAIGLVGRAEDALTLTISRLN
ncbi:serine/threonine-protein kinase [Sphingomonas sp. AR_OL41]|uniref:serine/threonine-protein kinase n=1 Tax=Sphingomonas sp. AR_OL41 TaxID=3042729 RepID=UPI002480A338|nr:serine/threonine-protein kinase [Sphingomonas sp. AR_OL41]MDH7973368.1 serine/threonine-protein kinase [Sphingomonas sp. AR_OL41]